MTKVYRTCQEPRRNSTPERCVVPSKERQSIRRRDALAWMRNHNSNDDATAISDVTNFSLTGKPYWPATSLSLERENTVMPKTQQS
jgi:hypothetical protein